MERNQLKTKTSKSDISKRPTGIFYLDGSRAFFFEQSLGSPLSLDFTSDIVSNLEVINRKKLEILIHTFIKNYKLVPKNIALVISPRMTFDKDFPHGSIEMEKNIEEFLELVPFEDVLNRRAMFSGRTKVVATNRELVDSVKSAFTTAGFIVSGVYPISLCIESLPELSSNMDLNLLVNKMPELKNFNMEPTVDSTVATTEKEKPNKTRLILLGGVFVFLIVILVFVFYKNIIAPPKTSPTNVLPTPVSGQEDLIPDTTQTETTNEVSSNSGEILPTENIEISPTPTI